MTIERKIDVEIDLTPEELALEFWKMGIEQRARFFNELGFISGQELPSGLRSLVASGLLTESGCYAMCQFGKYIKEAE